MASTSVDEPNGVSYSNTTDCRGMADQESMARWSGGAVGRGEGGKERGRCEG